MSQVELAGRAGVPQPVLSAYERGRREPGAGTLLAVLAAAGFELRLEPAPVDPFRAGERLRQVLELADALPRRRRGPLRYPRLPAGA